MAGRGTAPKANAARRNAGPETTKLVAASKPQGPPLPKGVLPDGEDWHPVTKKWWDHWRRSPQASRMLSGPDWDFLLDTALLHHIMWGKGRWEYAAEVRLRVAKFGATPEDRLRLRAEIVAPEQHKAGDAPVASVTNLQERRRRLEED